MAEPPVANDSHPALARIVRRSHGATIDQALSAGLSSSDLTTLLLHAFDRRSASVRPADVMRQYGRDRFVSPTPVDALTLGRLEVAALEGASPKFEPVTLAPLVPFGAHRAMGGTPQNNVVSTSRTTEVAADPTNSLALEAAVRRRELLAADSGADQVVNLAAALRVTRAQPFEGPRSFAHFSLFGLVSAGRDTGNLSCETNALRDQLTVLTTVLQSISPAPIELRLSAFTATSENAVDELADTLESARVRCTFDPERSHGRGYYRNICFKLFVEFDDGMGEVGDGGDVWWTQDLLQNKKERLVISGLGLERVALLVEQGR